MKAKTEYRKLTQAQKEADLKSECIKDAKSAISAIIFISIILFILFYFKVV